MNQRPSRTRTAASTPALLLALSTIAAVSTIVTPAAAQPALTGGSQLARAYDAILDARFDEVPDVLAAACPPAPVEACQLLEAVAAWWRIQIDPHDRTRDGAFITSVDAAVDVTEAWTRREPERAEAWFYFGGALGARAQWRVLRGERLAAARDGGRIKEVLERALGLDPSLHDAYVGLGLYHYYAAVAPAAAKVLRWLMLLPGGNRTQGLQEVLKAKNAGVLLRDEADYQLQAIYLLYEQQPAEAIELLQALDERHPRNPHFLHQLAEAQDYRLRDFDTSRRSYERLLQRALSGGTSLRTFAETHARLGLARLSLPADALTHLQHIVDARPLAPFGALAQAQLQRGETLERLGRRSESIAAYRAAIAASPSDDRLKIAAAARRAIAAAR